MEPLKPRFFVMTVGTLLLTRCQAVPQPKVSSISVTNGGLDGKWGLFELCPPGLTAAGVSLRRDFSGAQDQTGVNGIQLHCSDGLSTEEVVITSDYAGAGIWEPRKDCIGYHVPVAFRIRLLPPEQETEETDKTGMNSIEFKCDSGEILVGVVTDIGEWGDYSDTCQKGICGLATKVQPEGGLFTDDTTLNDAQFLCC